MANGRQHLLRLFYVFIFVFTKSSYSLKTTTTTPPSQQESVIFSTDAAADSAPFIVSLEYNEIYYCSGNILSANWIVTAAHCLLADFNVNDSTIVAGRMTLAGNTSTTQKRSINNYIVHDLYDLNDRTSSHDIALVYTAIAFTWSSAVAAIALPDSSTIPSGNALLYGWDKFNPMKTLQVANVPIIAQDACQSTLNSFGSAGEIHTTHVCTNSPTSSGGGGGKCTAYSGSPLVQQTNNENVLIGIVSWGFSECGRNEARTVYVMIASQLSWINATIPIRETSIKLK